MKGVLLDTNIILDFALEQREFFEKSKELLGLTPSAFIMQSKK
jgi:rRNA-processing protein FCF1